MALDNDLEAVLSGAVVQAPATEEATAPALSVVSAASVNPIQLQWERFKPQFAEAMEGGLYEIEDLERKIGQGRAYLFPGKSAAIVGEKAAYPGETVFQVLWAVGDMAEILSLAPGVESFARLIGCSSMLVEGRKGWEKALNPFGYEPWSVTVRKGL